MRSTSSIKKLTAAGTSPHTRISTRIQQHSLPRNSADAQLTLRTGTQHHYTGGQQSKNQSFTLSHKSSSHSMSQFPTVSQIDGAKDTLLNQGGTIAEQQSKQQRRTKKQPLNNRLQQVSTLLNTFNSSQNPSQRPSLQNAPPSTYTVNLGITQPIVQQQPAQASSLYVNPFVQPQPVTPAIQDQEEVLPEGVNRPQSLEVGYRHNVLSRNERAMSMYGGQFTPAGKNGMFMPRTTSTNEKQKSTISQSLNIYEQLRQSSGLIPLNRLSTALEGPPDGRQTIIPGQQQHLQRNNDINSPQSSSALDNKITEILKKYFSPERKSADQQTTTTHEFNALKQISETLNNKLDTFQQQLQAISKNPKMPNLYTTETQTEFDLTTEEFDNLKIENMRLQEKLLLEKQQSLRDQELMSEHLKHYQQQIVELKQEIKSLDERLHAKRNVEEQERLNVETMSVAKDQLIKQLTVKLQEQTGKLKNAKEQIRLAQEQIGLQEQQESQKMQELAQQIAQQKDDELNLIKQEYEAQINQQKADLEDQLSLQRADYEKHIDKLKKDFENTLQQASQQQSGLKRQNSDLKSLFDQQRQQLINDYQQQIEQFKQENLRSRQEASEIQQTMTRKDSDMLKTRERLSKMERDYMTIKEQNEQFKLEIEDLNLQIDSAKRNDNSTRNTFEQKYTKIKEQLSLEKSNKESALNQLREVQDQLDKIKEYGKAKLQEFQETERDLQEQIENLNLQVTQASNAKDQLEANLQEVISNAQLSQSESQRAMSDQLDDKNTQIRDLTSQVEQLKLDITKLQPKLDKKRQSISLIKMQQEQVQSEVRIKEGQIELLQQQHRQELQNKLTQIEDLGVKITNLQDELRETKSKNIGLEEQIANQREALLKGNESQVKALQETFNFEKQQLITQLHGLTQEKEGVQEKLKLVKEKHSELKKTHEHELTDLKSKHTLELESLQSKLSSGVADLLNKSKEAQNQTQMIQQLKEQFTSEIGQKQAQLKDLQEKYNHVMNQLRDKERECESMSQTIEILQGQSTDQEQKLQQLNQSLQDQIQQLLTQVRDKEQDIQLVTESFQKQIQQLQLSSQETVKSLSMQLSEFQNTITLKEQDIKLLNDQLSHQQTMVSKLKDQLQQIQEGSIDERQAINSQLNTLLQEKSILEKDNLQKQAAFDSLTLEKNALQDKLDKKKAKTKQLHQSITSNQDESNQLKSQITSITSELQNKLGEAIKDSLFKSQQIERSKKEQDTIRQTLEQQIEDLQRIMQQMQTQKRDQEDLLKQEIKQIQDKLQEEKNKHQQSLSESELQIDKTKREMRDCQVELETARNEIELLKLNQKEKGEATSQQQDMIERLNKQVQGLTKDIRDREEMISQISQQSQVQQQEIMQKLNQQQQDSHKQVLDLQQKINQLEQKAASAQQKCDQQNSLTIQFTTELASRDSEIKTLKADLKARDDEIQNFFDTDYKQLQKKYDEAEDQIKLLENKLLKLKQECAQEVSQAQQQSSTTNETIRPLVEEIQKQKQTIIVKNAETESLKGIIKELRESLDENDSSKELQELKKQQQFNKTEKEMKDITINQLKQEVAKLAVQVMEAKEKEANMASVINALTVQNAMINSQKTTTPQVKPSPDIEKKKAGGKPNLSLI